MTYPTPKEIKDALAAIAPRSNAEHKALCQKVEAAFDRDRGRCNQPDGYPTSTLGGDGGRTTAELTSVEAAANIRVFGRHGQDELRHHLEELYAHIVEAAGHQRAIDNRLRLIGAMTGDVVDNTRWCDAHARIGVQVDSYKTGTVGGRLDRPASLCHPCYDVVQKWLCRLPTPDEVARHQETGRWRITGQQVAS